MTHSERSSPLRLAVFGNERVLSLASSIEKRLCRIMHPVLKFTRTDTLAARINDFDAIAFLSTSSEAGIDSVAELLAQHGKHLFVEAAILKTVEMVNRLSATYRHSAGSLMASFGLRHDPTVKTIRERLANGSLGRPGLLRVHSWNPQQPIDEHLRSLVDLACRLFQASPTVIQAYQQATGASSLCINLHLGFPSGGMALIDLSCLDSAKCDYFAVSLIGSHGAAYGDDHHNMQLQFRGAQRFALVANVRSSGILSQLQHCVDVVVTSDERLLDVTAAITAIEVSEQAVPSFNSGTVSS